MAARSQGLKAHEEENANPPHDRRAQPAGCEDGVDKQTKGRREAGEGEEEKV